MPRKSLTEKDKKYIRENYLLVTRKVLCEKTGCSLSNVAAFMKRDGLVVPSEIKRKFQSEALQGKSSATPEEDEIIKREYLRTPVKTLCDKFLSHRSHTFVFKRIKQLGLVIPPEVIEQRKKDSQLKKGNIPGNKGKKQTEWMSADNIKKTAATRFKKGNQPHNTKYDHCIVVRTDESDGYAYKYIRLSKAKWVLFQRFVWEKHHGPIPENHIIVFRDGDSMNCNIDNLEMISKGENAIRNNPNINLTDEAVARFICTKSRIVDSELKAEIMQHHPDLIQLKRNQLLLNRAIKEHGKK